MLLLGMALLFIMLILGVDSCQESERVGGLFSLPKSNLFRLECDQAFGTGFFEYIQ
jgi:hypothetical protein